MPLGFLIGRKALSWITPEIPQPAQTLPPGAELSKASTNAYLKKYYGVVEKVPGTIVFKNTSDADSDGNPNDLLHIIVVWGYACQSIDEVYLDDIGVSTDNELFFYEGERIAYALHFPNGMTGYRDPILEAAGWEESDNLAGCACSYIRLEYTGAENTLNSEPQITASLTGTSFSNPLLVLQDYLTNPIYGKGADSESINLTKLAAEAAIADSEVETFDGSGEFRKLFTFNGGLSGENTVLNNVKEILRSFRGHLPILDGKLTPIIEKDDPPVSVEILESDILELEPITNSNKNNRYNRVVVEYYEPSANATLQEAFYPDVGSAEEAAWLAQDNGVLLEKSIKLHTCRNYYEAYEHAKVFAEVSRQQLSTNIVLPGWATIFEVGDIVNVSHSDPGWTQKPFRIVATEETTANGVDEVKLFIREHQPASYTKPGESRPPEIPDTAPPGAIQTPDSDPDNYEDNRTDSTYVYISYLDGEESGPLQTFLDAVPPGSHVIVTTRQPGDCIFINSALRLEVNNTRYTFQAPLLFGPAATLMCQGQVDEGAESYLLNASAYAGQDYFDISDSSRIGDFNQGTVFIVRGLRDGTTGKPEDGYKETYTVSRTDGNRRVFLTSPIIDAELGYLTEYDNPDYLANFGETNKTRLYVVAAAPLTQDAYKHDNRIFVSRLQAHLFSKGKAVSIASPNTSDDNWHTGINNETNIELARIESINPVTGEMILDHTLNDNFYVADDVTVTQLKSIDDISIDQLSIFYARTARTKRNGLDIKYAVNSRFENIRLYGLNGFSFHRHGIRVEQSLYCDVVRPTIFAITGRSSESYGVTFYGPTYCSLDGGDIHHARHSVLLFDSAVQTRVSNVNSYNCQISDFDCHGGNCKGTVFENDNAYFGESVQANSIFQISDYTWANGELTCTVDLEGNLTLNLEAGDFVDVIGDSYKVISSADYNQSANEIFFRFKDGLWIPDGSQIEVTGAENDNYNGEYTITRLEGSSIVVTPTTQKLAEQMRWQFSPAAVARVSTPNIDGRRKVLSIIDTENLVLEMPVEPMTPYFENKAYMVLKKETSKAGFRVGNPTHFVGDQDTRVLNCGAYGFRPIADGKYGAAVNVQQGSSGVIVEGFVSEGNQHAFIAHPNTKKFSVGATITAASWSNGQAVLTLDNNLLSVGEYIDVEGATNTNWNVEKAKVIDSVDLTVTIEMQSDPGSYDGAGVVSTVHPYLDMPLDDMSLQFSKITPHPDYCNSFAIDIDGNAPHRFLSNVTLFDSSFEDVKRHINIKSVNELSVVRNRINEPDSSSVYAYAINIEDCPQADIRFNDFSYAQRGLRLADSPQAVVTQNSFDHNQTGVVFEDAGGNTDAIFQGNTAFFVTNPQAVYTDTQSAMTLDVSPINADSYTDDFANTGSRNVDPTKLLVWLVNGQSLSTGSTNPGYAGPNPVFTNDVVRSWLFNGVSAAENTEELYLASQAKSITPFVPREKQTMGYGGMSYLAEQNLDHHLLYAPAGKGGFTIEQLSNVQLQNSLLLVDSVPEAIKPLNIDGNVMMVMSWVHVESLFLSNTRGDFSDPLIEDYVTKLRALHDQMTARVLAVTGQSVLPLFIDLSGSPTTFVKIDALYRYCSRYSDAFLVGPKYYLNRNYSTVADTVHLDPLGYTLQGEYHALAIQRWLDSGGLDGGDSKCFQIETVSLSPDGRKIHLDCHVPVLPIVEDNMGITDIEHYGIKLTGNFLGEKLPVYDVSFEGSRITLHVGYQVMPGMLVHGGRNSDPATDIVNGANYSALSLRDSQNIESMVSGEILYNRMVEFYEPITDEIVGSPSFTNLWTYGDVIAVGLNTDDLAGVGSGDSSVRTGMYYVKADVTVNASRARLMIGDGSIWFGEATKAFTGVVEVSDASSGRLEIVSLSTEGFDGTINNIELYWIGDNPFVVDPNPYPELPNLWTYGDVVGDGINNSLLAGVWDGNAEITAGDYFIRASVDSSSPKARIAVGSVNTWFGSEQGTIEAIITVTDTLDGRLVAVSHSSEVFNGTLKNIIVKRIN